MISGLMVGCPAAAQALVAEPGGRATAKGGYGRVIAPLVDTVFLRSSGQAGTCRSMGRANKNLPVSTYCAGNEYCLSIDNG